VVDVAPKGPGISLSIVRLREIGFRRAEAEALTADPSDVQHAVVGLTYSAASPGWQASALRLIDVLKDGLRPASGGLTAIHRRADL
jgi:hypothetical protein